jgi:hypothetical protein
LEPRYTDGKFTVYGHDRLLQIRNTQFQAEATHAIAVAESKGDSPLLSFSGDLVISVEVNDDE